MEGKKTNDCLIGEWSERRGRRRRKMRRGRSRWRGWSGWRGGGNK